MGGKSWSRGHSGVLIDVVAVVLVAVGIVGVGVGPVAVVEWGAEVVVAEPAGSAGPVVKGGLRSTPPSQVACHPS